MFPGVLVMERCLTVVWMFSCVFTVWLFIQFISEFMNFAFKSNRKNFIQNLLLTTQVKLEKDKDLLKFYDQFINRLTTKCDLVSVFHLMSRAFGEDLMMELTQGTWTLCKDHRPPPSSQIKRDATFC